MTHLWLRFVIYVNGEKQVTDVRTNDDLWHLVCVTWASEDGAWTIYLDGLQKDTGTGLANGTTIEGKGIAFSSFVLYLTDNFMVPCLVM